MSRKLPVNGFKWVEKISRFNEIFIKNYNENSDIGYFPEVDKTLKTSLKSQISVKKSTQSNSI